MTSSAAPKVRELARLLDPHRRGCGSYRCDAPFSDCFDLQIEVVELGKNE